MNGGKYSVTVRTECEFADGWVDTAPLRAPIKMKSMEIIAPKSNASAQNFKPCKMSQVPQKNLPIHREEFTDS